MILIYFLGFNWFIGILMWFCYMRILLYFCAYVFQVFSGCVYIFIHMGSGIVRLCLGKVKEKGFVFWKGFELVYSSCDYLEVFGFESITYINDFICMVYIVFKRWV